MAALATVADYLSEARILLEDTVEPYRYDDASLVSALNLGLLETRRLRSDLFLGRFSDIPTYSAASPATAVVYDDQYRPALLYYIIGHAQMRDQEDNQDTRAAAFKNKFVAQLLSIQA